MNSSRSIDEAELKEAKALLKKPRGRDADRILDGIVERYEFRVAHFRGQIGLGYFVPDPEDVWKPLLDVMFIRSVCIAIPQVALALQTLVNKNKKVRPALRFLLRGIFRELFMSVESLDTAMSPHATATAHWQHVFDAFRKEFTRKAKKVTQPPAREAYKIFGFDYAPSNLELHQDEARPT